MSRYGHNSFAAGVEELPIPDDVKPGPGWTEQMIEMAEHIGPYRALQLVERFGGMRIYIPADPERGKVYEGRGSIVDCIGRAAAERLSAVYRREYLEIPTARYAVQRAKRAPILAEVRAGRLSTIAAARRLGTKRSYVSHLIHNTDEGLRRAHDLPSPPPERDPAQMDLFGDGDEE